MRACIAGRKMPSPDEVGTNAANRGDKLVTKNMGQSEAQQAQAAYKQQMEDIAKKNGSK